MRKTSKVRYLYLTSWINHLKGVFIFYQRKYVSGQKNLNRKIFFGGFDDVLTDKTQLQG